MAGVSVEVSSIVGGISVSGVLISTENGIEVCGVKVDCLGVAKPEQAFNTMPKKNNRSQAKGLAFHTLVGLFMHIRFNY